METVRHLLQEENGSDRIKFDFDLQDCCKNKETFKCRRCGRPGYRSGEFGTIKLGDIFTHITQYPEPSADSKDLCTQCCDSEDGPDLIHDNDQSNSVQSDYSQPSPYSQSGFNNNNNYDDEFKKNHNNNTVSQPNNVDSTHDPITLTTTSASQNGVVINSFVGSDHQQGTIQPNASLLPNSTEGPHHQARGVVVLGNSLYFDPSSSTPPTMTTTTTSNDDPMLGMTLKQEPGVELPSSTAVPTATVGSNGFLQATSNTTFTYSMINPILHPSLNAVTDDMQPSAATTMNLGATTTIKVENPIDQQVDFISLSSATCSNVAASAPVISTAAAGSSSIVIKAIGVSGGGVVTASAKASKKKSGGVKRSASTAALDTSSSPTSSSASPIKTRECLICNRTFKSCKIAAAHFERVHQKEGKICCHICGIVFKFRGNLDSHLASAHKPPPPEEGAHECSDCGQRFKVKSNLTNHMKVHADNGSGKRFECEYCPSSFGKRVNLRSHLKRKHPEMVVSAPGTVNRAESSSNSSEPFVNINNNTKIRNINNNNLKSGERIVVKVEKDSNNMSYNPLMPPSSGTMATGMDKPVNSSNNKSNKPGGSFKCEHCGRLFLFKNNLKAHLRTHTRDKKYTCEICEKSFIYKESLKNHMLLHSNELPYHCDICGKKFRDRSNRRKHVKNVHKYMFMNGEVNSGGTPNPNFNGQSPLSSSGAQPVNTANNNNNNNGASEPKRKRNNNNKNKNSQGEKPKKKKPATSTVVGVGHDNNGHSVIVTSGTAGLDQDRKVIMSPKPMSPHHLEYSQQQQHSSMGGVIPGPVQDMHGHYRDQLIKSEPGEMDIYGRSQNVIVYPKMSGSAEGQGHLGYFHSEEVYNSDPLHHHQGPGGYLPLDAMGSSSSPPGPEATATRPGALYEYVHQPQQQQHVREEPEQLHVGSLVYGSPEAVGAQYGSHPGSSYGAPESTYHHSPAVSQHLDPAQEHRYWSVVQDGSNGASTSLMGSTVPVTTYTDSTVAYESPITAASNVLNHPSYGGTPDGSDANSSGMYYKDLAQFDFSYL